ncbi:MAG: efflux RND transporter permease subunit [Tannerella sp.]|jgi:HAE1 family hydrophobic/amphiphilic exporter-1|nr:efflux RND transporter permease subunit [Tannerella sp.]
MKLLNLIIKRPTIVVVLFTILVGAGLLSYGRLNRELFAHFDMPIITISTIYPGASPEETESSVSKKIEDAVSSLENIDEIATKSMEGFSYVIIQFKDGTDANISARNAQRKVTAIRSELPVTVREPSVDIFDINDMPVMTLVVTAALSDVELYSIVKNDIVPLFEQIQGIARVSPAGGREREIQVDIDGQRLAAYGMTIPEVSSIIGSSNTDFPAGKITDGEKQVFVRLSGKFQAVSDIENLIVKTLPDGSTVKVSDIAGVYDGQKDIESITRYNGVNAIAVSIQKQPDANAVKVSGEVRERIRRMENKYKDDGLSFQIAYNSSDFTIEATDSVIKDLLMAVLFVALAMLLCLHSVRNALIVMVAVPVSLISTFAIMYPAGVSLNLMTLMALSLVIGILVDDSIIVIENIHRHLETGKTKVQATLDGVREIGSSIITLTLVLVVVFLPVAFLGGMTGGFLGQFSFVIAVAALISLLVSLTIIPSLTVRFGKLETVNTNHIFGKFIRWFENALDAFGLKMRNLLRWSLNHKLITFGITALLLISSVGLFVFGIIGTEFMDAGDRGEFYVRLKMPKDATIEQTNLITLQTEELLKQQPLITSLFTTVGVEENGSVEANRAEINAKMVDYDKRNISDREYARQIKLFLQQHIVDAEVTCVPTSVFGGSDDAPIELYVTGDNTDEILQAASLIMDNMQKIPGISDMKISVEAGNPEITVTLNREKMARLGVSQPAVGEALNYAFTGNTDIKFRDNDREYDINIRLDKHNRKSKTDIENLTIINNDGAEIKLRQIALISESESPSRLERYNRTGSVTISSMVAGRPSGDIGDDVIKTIESLDLPDSIHIKYAGDMENREEGFGDMGTVMIISVILVYLLMVLLYNSYLHPFVIILSIPLAVIGVFFTLGLAATPLGIITLLGIVILTGLVARNAILVVDFINQQLEKGIAVKEAILEATSRRFRPILLTTVSTVVGMIPIAIAHGAGAEWKNGLGWVLIGGLTSSMFLSLIIIPLVYYGFYRVKEKWSMLRFPQR